MSTSTPNWCGYLDGVWAWPVEFDSSYAVLAGASNVVVGQNPPYTIQDFFAMYPKWGGVPVTTATATTSGSPVVVVTSATGLAVGNPVAGLGIPDGALIASISGLNVTLSVAATATAASITLTVWNATIVPLAVIAAYIYAASASLVQARWLELWTLGIGLYVAHFLTLYAQSDGTANPTIQQAAAQGLATGITVSKSVGDVSVSYQPVGGLETWAAWNLTVYGQQLATFAKAVGSGPMLLY